MIRTSTVAAALLACAPSAFAGELPRYQFTPGQEWTYRSTSEFKNADKSRAGSGRGSRMEWTLWMVRANRDGSTRLVIRQEDFSYYVVDGKKQEQPPRTSVVYVDVFSDGRIVDNETIRYRSHPGAILPRLPKDAAEAAAGWIGDRNGDRVIAHPIKGDGFQFQTEIESVFNAIYLSSSKSTYTFENGRVARAESLSTQGYGFNGATTGKTTLVGVKAAEPKAFKLLAVEEGPFFASLAAYDAAMESAGKAGAEGAKKALDAAVAALKKANPTLSCPMLKTVLDEKTRSHEQMGKYTIEDAARRAKVVGKPAPTFDTKDFDGRAVKLADLKGKVVVLDFWYRGCGWCIKAMPQMNELAADFAGKPVAIFGMNTDPKDEDAKFVIEKMQLKYPTLRATGLPEKFGVQGFPSLIVIDQAGNVHDFHVGYTPTLRVDLGKQISDLLATR